MEPSDEELGAFNLSKRPRLWEVGRQGVLPEEVGRVQDETLLPANGVWVWVDTVGQIRFWYRFCPCLAVWPWASILPSLFPHLQNEDTAKVVYRKVLASLEEPGRWQRAAVGLLGVQTNQVHSSALLFISWDSMQVSSSPGLIYPSVQWG